MITSRTSAFTDRILQANDIEIDFTSSAHLTIRSDAFPVPIATAWFFWVELFSQKIPNESLGPYVGGLL